MQLLSDQADDIRALVGSADPGAVWAVGGPGGVHAASHTCDGTAFDVGALAAVLALWPALGSLVEEGALRLHTPLSAYGDEAAAGTPAGTTAHHLLTHADGAAVLTRLAEHLSGSPLAELAAARVWHPLGMTRTRFAEGAALHAPLTDLVRFLSHLAAPADTDGPTGITRAWTAESLRIRTGELTPARGLLWHPAPHGVWAHTAPAATGPALWVCPGRHRWALLLPTLPPGRPTTLRSTFRDAAFALP
ncbi:hypothetical protein ACFWP3_08795 [Streptomyces sp. NPDC058525]|uniref:hypothetical protein n=1 Tax=unclassified Streptomyces TaxID=2593676 RepID=UPI0036581479